MKSIILGIFATLTAIYTMLISISIYSVSVRKNEVEKSLQLVLWSAMDRYYVPDGFEDEGVSYSLINKEVEENIIFDIEDRLQADSDIDANVYVCDMEKGIISAAVDETFYLPLGGKRTVSCSKTIIVDRDVTK